MEAVQKIEDIALAASKPAARKKAEKPDEPEKPGITEKPESTEAAEKKPAPRRATSKAGSKGTAKAAEDAE